MFLASALVYLSVMSVVNSVFLIGSVFVFSASCFSVCNTYKLSIQPPHTQFFPRLLPSC